MFCHNPDRIVRSAKCATTRIEKNIYRAFNKFKQYHINENIDSMQYFKNVIFKGREQTFYTKYKESDICVLRNRYLNYQNEC